MDFSKSKVLLKKINAIHESAASFDQEFSALERDLILQYLRSLYDVIAAPGENKANHVAKSTISSTSTPAPKKAAPIVQEAARVANPTPVHVPIHQVPIQAPLTASNPTPASAAEVAPTVAPSAKTIASVDPDMAALFDIQSNNDLSNRLANAPIKDIGRAMGINERILTINELFGGNQQLFQDTVNTLNRSNSFAEAAQHLMTGVAQQQEWLHPARKKKAEVFIKLISRKFN